MQVSNAIDPILLVCVNDDLGVAFGTELVTLFKQFPAQCFVVPYFPVKHDPDIADLIRDRLMAAIQVYDAQTSITQAGGCIYIGPTLIWSAMRDKSSHPL